MHNPTTDKENAKKELEKFKQDFIKLMLKHHNVMVASDMQGDLVAYHMIVYNTKIHIG